MTWITKKKEFSLISNHCTDDLLLFDIITLLYQDPFNTIDVVKGPVYFNKNSLKIKCLNILSQMTYPKNISDQTDLNTEAKINSKIMIHTGSSSFAKQAMLCQDC